MSKPVDLTPAEQAAVDDALARTPDPLPEDQRRAIWSVLRKPTVVEGVCNNPGVK